MKQVFVHVVSFYQKIISPFLKQLLGVQSTCRFSPTCSEYAKITVQRYGIVKGGYLSVVRILKCQPFYSPKFKEKTFNTK